MGHSRCPASFEELPNRMRWMQSTTLLLLALTGTHALFNRGAATAPRPASTKTQFRGRVVPTKPSGPDNDADLADLALTATITAMRVGTCALMVHHGLDKIQVSCHRRPTLIALAS